MINLKALAESQTLEFKSSFSKEYKHLKMEISESGNFFKVIIFDTPLKTPLKNPNGLMGLEKKIIKEVQRDSAITRDKLGVRLKIGKDTVAEYIKKLKEKGILVRKGSKRSGYWEIIN